MLNPDAPRVLRAAGRLKRLAEVAASVVPVRTASASERARALQRASVELMWSLGLDIHRTGRLPRGPCVMVANHTSWLDPFLVASLAPCAIIAKQELGRWPWVGERCEAMGVLLVDRLSSSSGASALRAVRRLLKQGVSVLNFPEGTTTRGETVLPFRRGVFGLAALLRAPVVPVRVSLARSLTWAGAETFVPHFLRLCATPQLSARLHFGAPLSFPPFRAAADSAEQARVHVLRPFSKTRGAHVPAQAPGVRPQWPADLLSASQREQRAH